MKPLDPRLLRQASAARRYVLLTTALGITTTALVVAQALVLARVIAGVAMDGDDLADVRTALAALIAIAVARAAVAGAQERFGHRAATGVVRQLRARLLHHAAARSGEPAQTGEPDGAALTVLATRGLDALDGYLMRYLPQLLLAATLTPAILVVILGHDLTAGLTILVTLPLIPLFMALVGMSTQASADRSLNTLQRLGSQVLDLIAGLPTLRELGAATRQADRVRQVGEAHRRATMRTLRSAFLSALVLETLTTLSVALVAVGIGLRLVTGSIDLRTGLTVLLLAPEVYLPLRAVGMQFHASVDGLAAAQQAFTFLELPIHARGTLPAPDLRHATIWWDDVSAVHRDALRSTPSQFRAHAAPGEILALTGPSGIGKSTAVAVMLGLHRPSSGRVLIRSDNDQHNDEDGVDGVDVGVGVDLADVDPATWWSQIAWAPQHPALVPGTLADNVRLTSPGASMSAIRSAALITGFDAVVDAVPGGWSARVGQGGAGLSAGQRQRLSLTRILLSDAPLVVLDEPTAHLDAGAERAIRSALGRLREQGRTVVLVAHRSSLAALADRVALVQDAALDAVPPTGQLTAVPVPASILDTV